MDNGFKAREMLLEREYQRVSISGEEKCGVRSSHANYHLRKFGM